jgi:hypothetical protein
MEVVEMVEMMDMMEMVEMMDMMEVMEMTGSWRRVVGWTCLPAFYCIPSCKIRT